MTGIWQCVASKALTQRLTNTLHYETLTCGRGREAVNDGSIGAFTMCIQRRHAKKVLSPRLEVGHDSIKLCGIHRQGAKHLVSHFTICHPVLCHVASSGWSLPGQLYCSRVEGVDLHVSGLTREGKTWK